MYIEPTAGPGRAAAGGATSAKEDSPSWSQTPLSQLLVEPMGHWLAGVNVEAGGMETAKHLNGRTA